MSTQLLDVVSLSINLEGGIFEIRNYYVFAILLNVFLAFILIPIIHFFCCKQRSTFYKFHHFSFLYTLKNESVFFSFHAPRQHGVIKTQPYNLQHQSSILLISY
jgi:hypothetical protein